MMTAQLPVTTSNETAVDTYVNRIKQHLTDATVAWRQIAEILAAAADEFGFDSDKMKSLRKQTKFSKSKASKLITIATNKRLRDHHATFETTNAWTVVYAVTKLTDQEFATLLENVSDGEIITQKTVNDARTKRKTEPDPYKTVFSIQIDINAIKSRMFSDYQELRDAIETIQDTLNHVRVVETDQFENDAARFSAEVARELDKVTRKEFNAAKKSYKKRAHNKKLFGTYSEEELRTLMREKDYQTAFDVLDSDRFDQSRLYDQALKNVYEKREKKFGLLVRPHDEYANTATQCAA